MESTILMSLPGKTSKKLFSGGGACKDKTKSKKAKVNEHKRHF